MGWVGSGHTKWTHGQLCLVPDADEIFHDCEKGRQIRESRRGHVRVNFFSVLWCMLAHCVYVLKVASIEG